MDVEVLSGPFVGGEIADGRCREGVWEYHLFLEGMGLSLRLTRGTPKGKKSQQPSGYPEGFPLVPRAGIEPATPGFSVPCSTN